MISLSGRANDHKAPHRSCRITVLCLGNHDIRDKNSCTDPMTSFSNDKPWTSGASRTCSDSTGAPAPIRFLRSVDPPCVVVSRHTHARRNLRAAICFLKPCERKQTCPQGPLLLHAKLAVGVKRLDTLHRARRALHLSAPLLDNRKLSFFPPYVHLHSCPF